MYSGRLSLVGDLLQGLFKEAYSLQKGLMELLDKINLEDTASEEKVSDIVTGLFFFNVKERFSLFHAVSREEMDVLFNSFDFFFFLFVWLAVIHSLLDICSIISRLDIALHANTWKFIIK